MPIRVASFSCQSKSPKVPHRPNSPVVGSHVSANDCVSNLLSSCDALTTRMLRLVANIALYFSFRPRSPFTHTPLVYEPRKYSSAIGRASTVIQYGNCPSVLRVEGSDAMPPPTTKERLKM